MIGQRSSREEVRRGLGGRFPAGGLQRQCVGGWDIGETGGAGEEGGRPDHRADADKLEVSCDGDLKGKKGETQDCTIEDGAGGQSLVKAEVTEVDGDEVTFDAKVFIASDEVETAIEDQLTSRGQEVESVTCDEDLPGTVGEEIECAAAPIGDLVVSTTAVDGLRVNFNFAEK